MTKGRFLKKYEEKEKKLKILAVTWENVEATDKIKRKIFLTILQIFP